MQWRCDDEKWVSLLIVLAIVVCAIFLFVGLVFPDVIHTSEEETLIFWDSRPVLNILVNPEKSNILYAGCGFLWRE